MYFLGPGLSSKHVEFRQESVRRWQGGRELDISRDKEIVPIVGDFLISCRIFIR